MLNFLVLSIRFLEETKKQNIMNFNRKLDQSGMVKRKGQLGLLLEKSVVVLVSKVGFIYITPYPQGAKREKEVICL